MRKLLYSFLILLICAQAQATHIVGGGFSLKWISGDTYELTLKVLRDCQNGSSQAPFNNPLNVGVFDLATNVMVESIQMTLGSNDTLSFVGPNCGETGTGCTHVGTYKKTITLSPSLYTNNVGYYFSWERCCRNNIIKNIVNPMNAGMTFYMQIPPPRFIKNSTPYFTKNPVTLLCVGNFFNYNLKFVDPDNDSLHYSLTDPINGFSGPGNSSPNIPSRGPYPPITWSSGFSNTNSIDGSPTLGINPMTGQLTVIPLSTGIYVASILVEEFRFGKKLGEVRLELQFNIVTCAQNPIPSISFSDTFNISVPSAFEVQVPEKICLNMIITDPSDSLFVEVEREDTTVALTNKPVFESVFQGYRFVTKRFCWQTDCKDADSLNSVNFKVVAKDNGCPIPSSSFKNFSIILRKMPLVKSTDLLCMDLDAQPNATILHYRELIGDNPYFLKYYVYRSKDSNPYVLYDSIDDNSLKSYTDIATPENHKYNYNYFMRAVNKCGKLGPTSDTLGTFDQLEALPKLQKLVTVTVENNSSLRVIWPKNNEKDFSQFLLYKGLLNQPASEFKLLYQTRVRNDTNYLDASVLVDKQSYCYYLNIKDTCGNYSPMGKPSCSILLQGLSNPFESKLTWNPYIYWDAGIETNVLYRRDTETPYKIVQMPDASISSALDKDLNKKSGKFWYSVSAQEKSTDLTDYFQASSLSNEIELIQKPLLYAPNAFTINNDGVNENWGLRDVFVKDLIVKIYDRWGKLVYENTDKYKQWIGQSNEDLPLPSDVYVYLVTYTGWDESIHQVKGNVTVIR